MKYILGIVLIGGVGSLLIWLITRRKKYVVIFLIVVLSMLLLPWILLFLACSSGAEFPD